MKRCHSDRIPVIDFSKRPVFIRLFSSFSGRAPPRERCADTRFSLSLFFFPSVLLSFLRLRPPPDFFSLSTPGSKRSRRRTYIVRPIADAGYLGDRYVFCFFSFHLVVYKSKSTVAVF